jgi:hypothetical protein
MVAIIIEILKSDKSLLQCMGYVKRKGSNAGKLTASYFNDIQEAFSKQIQKQKCHEKKYQMTLAVYVQFKFSEHAH